MVNVSERIHTRIKERIPAIAYAMRHDDDDVAIMLARVLESDINSVVNSSDSPDSIDALIDEYYIQSRRHVKLQSGSWYLVYMGDLGVVWFIYVGNSSKLYLITKHASDHYLFCARPEGECFQIITKGITDFGAYPVRDNFLPFPKPDVLAAAEGEER